MKGLYASAAMAESENYIIKSAQGILKHKWAHFHSPSLMASLNGLIQAALTVHVDMMRVAFNLMTLH